MKTINNSFVEVLPALLNKTKTSTMRKAWKEIKEIQEIDNLEFGLTKNGIKPSYTEKKSQIKIIEKPPQYEVGEQYKMVWDEEEKEYTEFCICHGIGFGDKGTRHKQIEGLKYFNKNFGVIEITAVNKIWLRKKENEYQIKEEKTPWLHYPTQLNGFAKREGFKSAEIMFKKIDKWVDLSTPREFWQYGMRWI